MVREYKEAAASTKPDMYWLAGTNITGDEREVTFLTFHDSFASVEKSLGAFESIERAVHMKDASFDREAAESEQASHSALFKLRDDLSYNPTKVDPAHTTRWRVLVVGLKPGRATAFAELAKERIELYKKGNLDEHWIAYQSMSGPPAIVFVTALRSLADLDADQSEARKAIFTPSVQRQHDAVVQETVAYTEINYVAVRPEMSRPAPALVAANPDFWTVKEAATVVAGKKTRKAKGAAEPASKPTSMKEKH
jgi:hypothetical protein